jgi:phage shock protein PspC (stress-responsive transcriptional regulator)
MKKTISITLNGLVFNIEEDAYERLNSYLDSLKRHFGATDYGKEVVADIESRIAEQFAAKLHDRKSEAVNLAEIEEVIRTMGTIEDLAGDSKRPESEAQRIAGRRRLYRNPDDQIIAGVASGIASYFNIDPLIPRILLAVSMFVGGYGILLYIIMWIIIPEAQTGAEKLEMRGNAVTVANLEESHKERKNRPNFSVVRYFFQEIFYLLGRVLRTLGSVILTVVGLIMTAVGFVALFGFTLLALILLFNPHSAYVDPTISQVFTGGQYVLLISSGFVAAVIPAILALLIGVSFVRRKNVITSPVGLTFVILWLASGLTFAYLVTSSAPQIEAAVKSIEERPELSREFQLAGFTEVRADRDQEIKITRGDNPRVIAYGREDELNDLNIHVQDNELVIKQTPDDINFCLFCIHRSIMVEVVLPELTRVDASHSSEVEITGFNGQERMQLDASGAAHISYSGDAENMEVDLTHAAEIDLSGQAANLSAKASGASSLEARNFQAETVTVTTEHSAEAEIYVTQKITAEASGASSIRYAGNPPEEITDTSHSAEIEER